MTALVLPALAVLAITELILIVGGARWYYRSGLPIYHGRDSGQSGSGTLDWKPRLKKLTSNEYAVLPPRGEALIFFPLMRGVLRINHEQGTREVVGRLSWFHGALTLAAVVAATRSDLWPFAIVVFVFDVGMFWFHVHRFRQVLRSSDVLLSRAV